MLDIRNLILYQILYQCMVCGYSYSKHNSSQTTESCINIAILRDNGDWKKDLNVHKEYVLHNKYVPYIDWNIFTRCPTFLKRQPG